MRTLTYTGRAHYRRLGPRDGLTVDITFPQGEPIEVADANAARILDLLPDQFHESIPYPHTPAPDAPSEGDTPTPEED